jgi:hypothetical protein
MGKLWATHAREVSRYGGTGPETEPRGKRAAKAAKARRDAKAATARARAKALKAKNDAAKAARQQASKSFWW